MYDPHRVMRKVSFSFPEELVDRIDEQRGALSRSQFVSRILERVVNVKRERHLIRITAEAYGDEVFAREEADLAEAFLRIAPDPDR